jgi:hypothetical protein
MLSGPFIYIYIYIERERERERETVSHDGVWYRGRFPDFKSLYFMYSDVAWS